MAIKHTNIIHSKTLLIVPIGIFGMQIYHLATLRPHPSQLMFVAGLNIDTYI
jgi:hypothetical protein